MSAHSNKKTKRSHPTESAAPSAAAFIAQHHPEKPSGFSQQQPTNAEGRKWTLSIAIPGSIVLNAQTQELRAWLAGQIARHSAIFCVTEIVVYRDAASAQTAPAGGHKPRGKYRDTDAGASGGGKDEEDPSTFLGRILEYLETPQYLRRALFPMHPSLRLAGLLPPLDCPHHVRRDDEAPFREGVVVQAAGAKKGAEWPLVDVGLWDPVEVEGGEGVKEGTRVTVRMPVGESYAAIVPPSTPTLEGGSYWGYSVRVADSLAQVFSECPYAEDGGYDLSVGTSERGTSVEQLLGEMPPFRHMLLTLGPLSGLELTIAADPLIPLGAEDAQDLFDHWVNVVEGQGSRTVRTEEALPIALARLKSTLEKQGEVGTQ